MFETRQMFSSIKAENKWKQLGAFQKGRNILFLKAELYYPLENISIWCPFLNFYDTVCYLTAWDIRFRDGNKPISQSRRTQGNPPCGSG